MKKSPEALSHSLSHTKDPLHASGFYSIVTARVAEELAGFSDAFKVRDQKLANAKPPREA
jgi:hypothetical protein